MLQTPPAVSRMLPSILSSLDDDVVTASPPRRPTISSELRSNDLPRVVPIHQILSRISIQQAEDSTTTSSLSRYTITYHQVRSVDHSFTELAQSIHGSLPSVGLKAEDMLIRSGAEETEGSAREALGRLRYLGTLDAGWDGTDVAAPIPTAIQDAMALIVELVNAGAAAKPRIGLDSDGSISFTFFRDGRAIADFTIPGDKTYSFYARIRDHVASMDDARIGWSIPRDLLSILGDR